MSKLTPLVCEDLCCEHYPHKLGDLYDKEEVDEYLDKFIADLEAIKRKMDGDFSYGFNNVRSDLGKSIAKHKRSE